MLQQLKGLFLAQNNQTTSYEMKRPNITVGNPICTVRIVQQFSSHGWQGEENLNKEDEKQANDATCKM